MIWVFVGFAVGWLIGKLLRRRRRNVEEDGL